MKKSLLLLSSTILLSSCLKWQTCEITKPGSSTYMIYQKWGQTKKKFKRECEAQGGVVK